MKIHLLTTGGTLEKVYSEQSGKVANFASKIDSYLQSLRLPETEIEARTLMNKDSLEMTDADRALVFDAVVAALPDGAPIVITHGTDTMVETGLYLKRHLPAVPVPIIFTGAMTPLGFERSDGLQNLTESLLAAKLLPAGIWLVMHNQVFAIHQVRKDRELAHFVAISQLQEL